MKNDGRNVKYRGFRIPTKLNRENFLYLQVLFEKIKMASCVDEKMKSREEDF